MLTMDELMAMLSGVGADFQFIEQDSPILFTSDANISILQGNPDIYSGK